MSEADHFPDDDADRAANREADEAASREADNFSRYLIRSVDGLRVALAGFPDATRVEVEEGVELNVSQLRELRQLQNLPCKLEILIPYRVRDDAAVIVRAVHNDNDSER